MKHMGSEIGRRNFEATCFFFSVTFKFGFARCRDERWVQDVQVNSLQWVLKFQLNLQMFCPKFVCNNLGYAVLRWNSLCLLWE